LNSVTNKIDAESVHLSFFPKADEKLIDKDLENRMFLSQKFSSMALSLRRSAKIKVRQPLQRLMIPVLDKSFENQIKSVKDIILGEVNIKEIELLSDTSGIVTKEIKPNFKKLGKKLGKNMKFVAKGLATFSQDDIAKFETEGKWTFDAEGTEISISFDEVDLISKDVPGWLVASDGKYTIALDVTITDELKQEGFARELINKVQNYRKDKNFEVTDKINLSISTNDELKTALNNHKEYISSQTLAKSINFVENTSSNFIEFDINGIPANILIEK